MLTSRLGSMTTGIGRRPRAPLAEPAAFVVASVAAVLLVLGFGVEGLLVLLVLAAGVVVWLLSPVLGLAALVMARLVADSGTGLDETEQLNPASVLGVVAVALGVAYLATGSAKEIRAWLVVHGVIGAFLLVGLVNFGFESTMVREAARSASLFAVGYIAYRLAKDRKLDTVHAILLMNLLVLVPAFEAVRETIADGSGFIRSDFRADGTFVHPNAAGALFGFASVCQVWYLSRRRMTLSALALLGTLGLGLVLTRSLTSFAAASVACLFVMFAGRLDFKRFVLVGASVAAVGVLILTPLGANRATTYAETQLGSLEDRQLNSLEHRFKNWEALVEEWQQRPILGHGIGTTRELVSPLDTIPHSEWVRLLVEAGLVGVCLMAVAIVTTFFKLERRLRRPDGLAVLGMAAMGFLFVQSLTSNLVLYTAAMWPIVVVIGVLMADMAAADRHERSAVADQWAPVP